MAKGDISILNGHPIKDMLAREDIRVVKGTITTVGKSVKTLEAEIAGMQEGNATLISSVIAGNIDNTLSEKGKIADAKATGEAIANVEKTIETVKGEIENKIESEKYVLPIASPDTLGGLKIGAGLSVNSAGTVSVTGGGVADSVDWENIIDAPETFPPEAHTHTWEDIENNEHSHRWEDIEEKPEMFTPSEHSHGWEEIEGKPEAFTPATHSHTPEEIGALPEDYEAPVLSVNGQTGHVSLASSPLDFYPVGSLYWSSKPTSPASLFGGTWMQIKDRFILSAGASYGVDTTGGSATHTLTSSQIPSHKHLTYMDVAKTTSVPAYHSMIKTTAMTTNATATANKHADYTSTAVGGGQAHNNMPPYIAKYCWERTA